MADTPPPIEDEVPALLQVVRASFDPSLDKSEREGLRTELLSRLNLSGPPTEEQVQWDLEERFLTPKRTLPEHWLSRYQVHWDREPDFQSLLFCQPSTSNTTLEFIRAGLEGRVVGYKEVTRPSVSPLTAKNSTSLTREPASLSSFVRGKSGYYPFAPGGLEDEVLKGNEDDAIRASLEGDGSGAPGQSAEDMMGGMEEMLGSTKGGLRSVPPGFSRGLIFEDEGEDVSRELFVEQDDTSAKVRPLHQPIYESIDSARQLATTANGDARPLDTEIDELLPLERPRVVASTSMASRKPKTAKRDWAHVVNVNKQLTNFHDLVPDMARKYPFELDNYQKEAVYHLEQGDSVFVAAHTSAGKTVVAEYAIALAQKHMTRAIYTSPIKALSNQKFRDFKQNFGASNVGILTGDVQINPEAPCLIMTTEILRSMLYKGADIIKDVEFVIFDEVHYVNDLERGVVWEEVIIMLPQHCSIIMLSATVPNTKEFAEWVGRTKKRDMYVISTPKRPVPLEHFLYAGKELHKIVDAKGQFLGAGMKDAAEALRRKQDKEREAAGLPPISKTGPGGRGGPARGVRGGGPNSRGGRGAMVPRGGLSTFGRGRGGYNTMNHGQGEKNLWIHLVGMLRKKSLLPVVVFTFSKKRCEENAGSMPNMDLCTAAEKSQVHIIIEKSFTRLKGSDRRLPQIARMRDLLSRGIGVHHGGLLPIVKEIVEMLFARGLVKVLFATETFAMGVNMPARSVVFSSIRKHDGRTFRDLLPGEYTQMSGRAGRRGLDATGVVIINASDDVPDTAALHKMLLGPPSKLQSQFRLTYNMILNLLRVEALKVEEMIKRSFSENASQRLLPDQQMKVAEAEKSLGALPRLQCQICEVDVGDFYDASLEATEANLFVLETALAHSQGGKLFGQGRVVILRDNHFHNVPAILVKPVGMRGFLVLGAVPCDVKRKGKEKDVSPEAVPPRFPPSLRGYPLDDLTYDLTEVPISSIALVTKFIRKINSERIDAHHIPSMQGAVDELVPLLSKLVEVDTVPEVDWSKIRALEFQEGLQNRASYVRQLQNRSCVLCADFERHYETLHAQKLLQAHLSSLRLAISDQNLELLPDYEQRVEVLKALQFIDPDNSTVLLKGRVACEINSADELILTELILENTLAHYEPEEVVALLSVFVFREKTSVTPVLSPKLTEGYETILSIADRVARAQAANQVNFEDYTMTLKTGLVEVVYEWARGTPFEQITDLTDVAEGTIVRVITRLDETCREVRDAARIIGDADLFKKMEEAQNLIRRDIVFAASLYF